MGRKYYKPYKSGKHRRAGHGGGLAGLLLTLLAGRRHSYHPPYRPSLKQSILSAILRRIFR